MHDDAVAPSERYLAVAETVDRLSLLAWGLRTGYFPQRALSDLSVAGRPLLTIPEDLASNVFGQSHMSTGHNRNLLLVLAALGLISERSGEVSASEIDDLQTCMLLAGYEEDEPQLRRYTAELHYATDDSWEQTVASAKTTIAELHARRARANTPAAWPDEDDASSLRPVWLFEGSLQECNFREFLGDVLVYDFSKFASTAREYCVSRWIHESDVQETDLEEAFSQLVRSSIAPELSMTRIAQALALWGHESELMFGGKTTPPKDSPRTSSLLFAAAKRLRQMHTENEPRFMDALIHRFMLRLPMSEGGTVTERYGDVRELWHSLLAGGDQTTALAGPGVWVELSASPEPNWPTSGPEIYSEE
jgi:hypothetical protein